MTASRPKVEPQDSLGFARRFIAPKFPRLAQIIDYPMVGPILRRIDENPGAIFVILGSPQIFKTFIGQVVALRSQLVSSVPALWYGKNKVTAEQVAEEKFNPLYDSCFPSVTVPWKKEPQPALLYADKNRRTKTNYTLPRGENLRFLSAGVPINRQGKSAQDIYLDEPWEYDAGWVKEIQRRRADFSDYREIHMLTGPTFGSFSHELWEQSSREVWHMRCTNAECRQLIPPEFGDGGKGGVKYESGPSVRDKDGKRILAATRGTVFFECPHCGTKYPNTPHSRTALNAGGEFVQSNPTPEVHIHGFRCPALPLRDWGDIAIEKIVADRAKKRGDLSLTEDLHRKTFADVWREDSHMTEAKVRPAGDYRMGEEWGGEATDPQKRPVRCCTVDVQQDHFVVVIRSWARSGESRLRWAQKVPTPGQIHDLCEKHDVPPSRVFLDGRFDSQQVRRIAANYGWKVLMGDGQEKDYFHKETGLRRIFSEPRKIDAFGGTKVGGVILEFNFSKQSALSRLHGLRTLTTADGRPLWTGAKDAPELDWKEIDAHYRKTCYNRDGSAYYVWHGLKEDHFGDCEAMQIVFASMAGLIGAESLETEAEEPKKEAS